MSPPRATATAWLRRTIGEGSSVASRSNRATISACGRFSACAAAIAAWSGTWFAAAGWQAASTFRPDDAETWTVLSQGTAGTLVGRPRARLELALALFGGRARPNPTDADLVLLRRLAGRAIDDLQTRLDTALPATAGSGPVWRLSIGPGPRPPLAIEIPQASLVALARRSTSPRAARGVLTPRHDAVADRPLRCAALLGTATLAVKDIDALEPGDVLLLDQPVDAAIPLLVEGKPSHLRFAIDRLDEQVTLILQD